MKMICKMCGRAWRTRKYGPNCPNQECREEIHEMGSWGMSRRIVDVVRSDPKRFSTLEKFCKEIPYFDFEDGKIKWKKV